MAATAAAACSMKRGEFLPRAELRRTWRKPRKPATPRRSRNAPVEGRQLVIACGGDGTLNEVVNGLAGHQNGHRVPLALLPGGTANIFAKELKLPWDIPGAAECWFAAWCARLRWDWRLR